MKPDIHDIDYYLVTDHGLSKHGILYDVETAIDAGCRIVQYREKARDTRVMVEQAAAIGRICRGRALFVINDRIDIALAVDTDGVHIGQNDMPYDIARRLLGDEKIIGLTTHSVDESREAERLGADYIGLSPIFETATKVDAGTGCGTGMVRDVRATVALPIVAIGGINLANTGAVIAAGADSVAAISAVVTDDDVAGRVREFIEVIDEARRSR